jgi:hypothetical protein
MTHLSCYDKHNSQQANTLWGTTGCIVPANGLSYPIYIKINILQE